MRGAALIGLLVIIGIIGLQVLDDSSPSGSSVTTVTTLPGQTTLSSPTATTAKPATATTKKSGHRHHGQDVYVDHRKGEEERRRESRRVQRIRRAGQGSEHDQPAQERRLQPTLGGNLTPERTGTTGAVQGGARSRSDEVGGPTVSATGPRWRPTRPTRRRARKRPTASSPSARRPERTRRSAAVTLPTSLDPFVDDPAHSVFLLDFDGSIAPIVDDPAAARPLPAMVDALRELVPLLGRLAVVSGRTVDFLATALPGRRPAARRPLRARTPCWRHDDRGSAQNRGSRRSRRRRRRRKPRCPACSSSARGDLCVTIHFRAAPERGDAARSRRRPCASTRYRRTATRSYGS